MKYILPRFTNCDFRFRYNRVTLKILNGVRRIVWGEPVKYKLLDFAEIILHFAIAYYRRAKSVLTTTLLSEKLVVGSAVFIVFVLGCGKPSLEGQANSNLDRKKTEETVSTNLAVKDNMKQTTEPSAAEKGQASSFQPFIIYADKGTRNNHYVPSGFMPDGKCLSLDDTWKENCHGGKSCIKIVYDTDCSKQGRKWAGIYWLNPANNWGSQKGGFNLTGAQKLTFWARGEKGDERIEEIKIGGITGEYPDSDSAVIGPVILTPEWKEYTIDLRGKDLSSISGGFTWATKAEVNPNGCTFYLDDIQYE